MAKYVTLISDPELETRVIRAITAINGELVLRAVSEAQILELDVDTILISNKPVNIGKSEILIDNKMTLDSIIELLATDKDPKIFRFMKGNSQVICFVGLSGGVGTSTLALNAAFEISQDREVMLADLDDNNPDIARYLGLHHIEGRSEHLGNNLIVTQEISQKMQYPIYVFDLGTNQNHPILTFADKVFLVTRLGSNTVHRLKHSQLIDPFVILNFVERTKFQQNWLTQIEKEFPKLNLVKLSYEPKSFELAAERKSALLEVAPNSLARKTIATLG